MTKPFIVRNQRAHGIRKGVKARICRGSKANLVDLVEPENRSAQCSEGCGHMCLLKASRMSQWINSCKTGDPFPALTSWLHNDSLTPVPGIKHTLDLHGQQAHTIHRYMQAKYSLSLKKM